MKKTNTKTYGLTFVSTFVISIVAINCILDKKYLTLAAFDTVVLLLNLLAYSNSRQVFFTDDKKIKQTYEIILGLTIIIGIIFLFVTY